MLMICFSITKTVDVKGSFRLFGHILQLQGTVLKPFATKLVIFGIG